MRDGENQVDILGVSIDTRDKKTVYEDIEDILSHRQGAKIFTPNGEILYRIRHSEENINIFNSASLSLPDGISVVLGGLLLGYRIPSRISGIDAAEYILATGANKGLSVYLLGGERGVAEAAAKNLTEKYPSLRISGTHHGYFSVGGEEEKELLRDIRKKAPDILFVCLGAPAQERWICENTPTLPSLCLSMGLGGSLDVWSGRKKRAPRAFRTLGLEWFYRILSSPERIKRLPDLVGFFFTVTGQAFDERKQNIFQKRNRDYRI